MTSLTRVRRLERVLAGWFEKSGAEIYDGTPQLICDIPDGRVHLHALAEELDIALDGILSDEIIAKSNEHQRRQAAYRDEHGGGE